MNLSENMLINDQLNPLLWDNNDLKAEVKEALDRVVDRFLEDLRCSDIPIHLVDVWIVGSNASYNYTESSDLDVHLIADMGRVTSDSKILNLLYNYYKASFNSKYDISIHGINVELYVEDVNTSSTSNGIYSLKHNMWVKFPSKIVDLQYEGEIEDSQIFQDLLNKYNSVKLGELDPNTLLDYLYVIRKLDLQHGREYGERNLAFKEFRNRGYLNELRDMIVKNISNELTLEDLQLRS